ncbi:hypothetical protein M0G43_04190 [Subsaxibacter sp. CAU 1640]|uniref:hypothetical protein n=1 Tax=Subsaxibacter sp. CAU 1640 TaxID=2933271 RepID=UPI002006D881|nr:hypothetical protein [Subsaxibacter sp. CAU 1640]MCK7589765.1 hypothetical protein [Subsaxibacter sp. CAU 1640]
MNQAIFYIAIGAIFDTCGDLLMKNWVLNNSKYYFLSGMIFYVIGLSFLAYSFTIKNIVVASVLFLIFNIIMLCLVNSMFFSESLNSKETLALFLGLIAVILFEFK